MGSPTYFRLKRRIRAILGDHRAVQLGRLVRSMGGSGAGHAGDSGPQNDSRRACQAMMHRPYDAVRAQSGFTRGEAHKGDGGVKRIVAAYQASIGASSVRATAIWESIAQTQQAPLHRTLMSADSKAVTAMLSRPGDSELFFGFDNLISGAVNTFRNQPEIETGHAKLCQDHLIRLGELTGAVRFANPEWPGGSDSALRHSADDLVESIGKVIGHPIAFPNPFPDEYGIKTRRGTVSYRAIHAIYQAWLIAALVKAVARPAVLEIGGGLGRTAYYLRQFGVADCTIVDLPFTGVSQAYFLMRTLGEDQVQLHGEGGEPDPGKVKLLNPDSFLNASRRYDLIVNIDSLTEMDRPTAENYVEKIAASTGMLLSINHEANSFTVKELFDKRGQASVYRREYGLRHGYVEELYRF